MNVYSKDIGIFSNPTPELGYRINGGSYTAISNVSTSSCDFYGTISGFIIGDTIRFETAQGYELGGTGSASSCPGTLGSITYDIVATGTGQGVSITINRDNIP